MAKPRKRRVTRRELCRRVKRYFKRAVGLMLFKSDSPAQKERLGEYYTARSRGIGTPTDPTAVVNRWGMVVVGLHIDLEVVARLVGLIEPNEVIESDRPKRSMADVLTETTARARALLEAPRPAAK